MNGDRPQPAPIFGEEHIKFLESEQFMQNLFALDPKYLLMLTYLMKSDSFTSRFELAKRVILQPILYSLAFGTLTKDDIIRIKNNLDRLYQNYHTNTIRKRHANLDLINLN